MPQSFDRTFFANLWRRIPITIITTGILVAGWAYCDFLRSPGSASGSNAAIQSVPSGSSKSLPVTTPLHTQPARAHAFQSALRRVQVAPNEVDYIADDVTMRIFTSRVTRRPVRRWKKQVHIGDDVTVRYFAEKNAMAQSVASSSPLLK
ncbi:MAG TPA: hypothetical protein VHW45_08660 [Candidatus Sulfotelmatobacter sp.]|jgi:hypothetical protein|nr:hypothetical protein [Candidatus Sulfotelmatobacter sp.]